MQFVGWTRNAAANSFPINKEFYFQKEFDIKFTNWMIGKTWSMFLLTESFLITDCKLSIRYCT